MRHRKSFNHLSRKAGHRKALMANMATSLIMHKRIETTTAKAKALRMYVEPLITKSKDDSTHSRRVVFSYLQNKDAVNELFREVSTKVATRPGGYTRILKTGQRLGDNADMCIIELVDYNENLLAAAEEAKAKTGTGKRRRRRGGSGKSSAEKTHETAQQAAEPSEEKAPETIEEKASEEEARKEVVSETPEEVVSDAEVIEEEKTETEEPNAEASQEEKTNEEKKEDSNNNGDDQEENKEK